MAFTNPAEQFTPGEVLLDAPISATLEGLAKAIYQAQLNLDANSVQTATALGSTYVNFDDGAGNVVQKSLLQLGFSPVFYHFTETTLEVSLTISLKVEQDLAIGFEFTLGNASHSAPAGATESLVKQAVPYGLAINVNYHRKYNFDMTGASKITTKMVSLPGPPEFLSEIKAYYNVP